MVPVSRFEKRDLRETNTALDEKQAMEPMHRLASGFAFLESRHLENGTVSPLRMGKLSHIVESKYAKSNSIRSVQLLQLSEVAQLRLDGASELI